GHGIDRYWLDTELFRCKGGNQRLASAFRRALKRGTVRLNTAVIAISRRRDGIVVTEEHEKRKRALAPVDDVVLAIPPSVWGHIKFDDRYLKWALKKAPALASNVKGLMQFNRRFWKSFASSPSLTDDGPADLTWETSEADRDDRPAFTMVAFSGAQNARTL